MISRPDRHIVQALYRERDVRGFLMVGALTFAAGALAQSPRQATHRARVLGVFDADDGTPIEGAQVTDLLSGTFALTTRTGTVSLVFLPEGGSLVRIRKVGYLPTTMMAAISPADTVPITVLLTRTVPMLPTVVTKDSAPGYPCMRLCAFEERRRAGFGHFIDEAELRKNDSYPLSSILPRLPGLFIKKGHAYSSRVKGSDCAVTIYVNGVPSGETDVSKMPINEYAGVEFYAGPATAPAQYNATGHAGRSGATCGIMLLWTRER